MSPDGSRYFGAEHDPETLRPSKGARKGALTFDRWLELSDFAGYEERRHEVH